MRFRWSSLFDTGAVGRQPQRWAMIAGWSCLLLPVPSLLWRLAMLAGADTGFANAEFFRGEAMPLAYVIGLDVVEFGAAVACFGLIRPWGERLPRWLPWIGGWPIHRLAATVVGGAGNLVLYALIGGALVNFLGRWVGLTDGWTPDAGMTPAQRAVLLVAYIPFFVWPLAVTIALVGYWLRRSPSRGSSPSPGGPGPGPAAGVPHPSTAGLTRAGVNDQMVT